ncbi:AraC family transcriptional regulator [Cellulomonas sp.]|uniref:AraC family transcriptional regulator n=1 Tax=Cellulomonas sp. TaxID=40001 RepID=UPI001B2CB4BF|nr:AraC family transcriptional regulator [Cellulomonas sp.]MBO9554964.1 helix-turn-helix transcriptional regulator [Cellulomonas sp.]
MVRRSSASGPLLPRTRVRRRRADGTPVIAYLPAPGTVPIGAELVVGGDLRPDHVPGDGPHAHDFHVLVHVERGAGTLRVDTREWALGEGDVCLVAPGEVVRGASALPADARVWLAFFTAEALGPQAVAPLAWRQHPLLTAFGRLGEGAPRVWRVPERERGSWATLLGLLAAETGAHSPEPVRPGGPEAAAAALTLLLVSLSRMASDVAAPPPAGVVTDADAPAGGWARDPIVAAVLDVVESRFREPVSTRDVAGALGYTTGHLTTVVRERSGRTVLEWLTERRMIEARRLLVETDLPVAVVAERTGYRDSTYLVRRFREQHGVTPLQWRRQARA